MPDDKPDYHDADLVLRVYELRREAVMRESRSAMGGKFWPKAYKDVAAILKPEHPLNAAFRQTSTYWEMVYGLAKHGIVNADFLIESNAEGLFLLAKVRPYLDRLRQEYSPVMFQNAEWIATQCAEGRRRFELSQARVRKMMESR